jgi:hypothetical protein
MSETENCELEDGGTGNCGTLGRRISRDGLGGTPVLTIARLCGGSPCSIVLPLRESIENVGSMRRSGSTTLPASGEGSPMRIRASRFESWLGFSRRIAFWVASRAVGEGGRGAGFIACATLRGIVGMLHDETTGPEVEVGVQ